jgi:hypothetical protein
VKIYLEHDKIVVIKKVLSFKKIKGNFMKKTRLSKDEKNKFVIFFKTWFNSQNKFRVSDISKELNIPESSLRDYILYDKSPNSIEKANVIINFIKKNQRTGLEPYKKETNIENIKENTAFLCQINELNNSLKQFQSSIETIQKNLLVANNDKKQKDETKSHIDNLKFSLLSLYSEIDWFKNKTNLERMALRKSLNANDVGYLTSMLRALIKGEEDFNDWLVMSNYQVEMLKWKKQH